MMGKVLTGKSENEISLARTKEGGKYKEESRSPGRDWSLHLKGKSSLKRGGEKRRGGSPPSKK